ncbi:MAG: response regulator [Alphaproteobacteria bacterium]
MVNAPKLLIVDDDQIMQRVLAAYAGSCGLACTVAADGHSGLVAATGQRFDLVVTDFNMPVMNGIEMIGRIRSGGGASAAAPILVITASDHAAIRRNAILAGADDFLIKPIHFEEFRRRTQVALGHTATQRAPSRRRSG